ncbi:MAG: hypothetical protein KF889_21605 [Alphaproteobacteria bacterium]|nr:hypothetical protein [Alphaproteobacteria bacterium]MCW5743654.1 hypothetical protein [Alphaproteobacteria bacterium]
MSPDRVWQVFQGIGLAWTTAEVGRAGTISFRQRSIRPLAVEGVAQAGSFAAGAAGFKTGGKLGMLVGLKTGPGVLATAAVGACIGGLAGYVGAKRFADATLPEDLSGATARAAIRARLDRLRRRTSR